MGYLDNIISKSMETPIKNQSSLFDYESEIVTNAKKYGLTEDFALKIHRLGEKFTPDNPISPKGARGGMQVMPGTFAEIQKELPHLRDIDDPKDNTEAGVYYLSKMLREFDNNPVYAAAAYNAGPGATRKALERTGTIPNFKETIDYVKRIFEPSKAEAAEIPKTKVLHSNRDALAQEQEQTKTGMRDVPMVYGASGNPVVSVRESKKEPSVGNSYLDRILTPEHTPGYENLRGGADWVAEQALSPQGAISQFAHQAMQPEQNLEKGMEDIKSALGPGLAETANTGYVPAAEGVLENPMMTALSPENVAIGGMLGVSEAEAGEMPQDYLDNVVMSQSETEQNQPSAGGTNSYLDKILSPMTISQTKPEQEKPIGPPVAASQEPADVWTLTKSGMVDDPTAKLKIFASKRFPDEPIEQAVNRYGIKDGKVFYIDNDRVIREEVPSGYGGREFVANLAAQGPETIGAETGFAVGGIPGMMIGAGAGRVAKELGSQYLLEDKPKGAVDLAKDAALSAGGSLVGYGIGKGAGSLINKIGAVPGGKIGKYIARDSGSLRNEDITRLTDLGEKYGIPLNVAEASGSPTLVRIWNIAATTPGEASEAILRWAENQRKPQLASAISRELDTIFPESSVYEASRKGVEAAGKSLKQLEGQRLGTAQPHYDAAMQSGTKVDINETLTEVERRLATANKAGHRAPALEKMKSLLTKTEEIQLPDGTIEKKFVPLDTIPELHEAKLEIDDLFKGKDATPPLRRVKADVKAVKDSLLNNLKTQSPEYAEGMKAWAEKSKAINEFMTGNPDAMPKDMKTKTVIARIAELSDEKISEAPKMLFNGDLKPEIIARTKKFLDMADPDAMPALVRAHFENKLDSIRDSIGTGTGKRLKEQVFGTPKQRLALKAAMEPDQYARWSEFMELLDVTNRTIYSNSLTTPLAITDRMVRRDATGLLGKGLRAWGLTAGSVINPRIAQDMLADALAPGQYKMLVDKMMDPRNTRLIRKVYQLPNSAEKGITFLGVLGGLTAGDSIQSDVTEPKTFYPEDSLLGQK